MTRLAVIVVLAFALAGCGSGSSDNEAASPTTHVDLADDDGDFTAVDADGPRLHAVSQRLDVSAEELEREPRDDVPHERHARR